MVKDPTKLKLSPSKVDTFFGCRRLFKYKYLAQPFVPEENKFFLIGNIAHKVLEKLHKEQMNCSEYNWRKNMSKYFKEAVKSYKAFSKIKEGVITKNDLYDIKFMLHNYLNYLKRTEIPNILQVEKLMTITIGGIKVSLKADRIDDLGSNMYRIVDYKSGSISTKKDELDSVQLTSYGILIRQLIADADFIKGQYLYLRHINSNKGVHTYDISDVFMDIAQEKYIKVDQQLKNGCDFKQNFKYKYCRFCDFKRHCLEDENDDL